MKKLVIFAILLAVLSSMAQFRGQKQAQKASSGMELRASAEMGFLAPLYHRIKFSENGTYFNYIDEGSQDVLFPVGRLSLDFQLNSRSTITFLYQPLNLTTQNIMERDVTIDSLLFPEGTPTEFVYNFPFYRVSYLYDLNPRNEIEMAIGLSLQLRDATIIFRSLDGELFRTNRDVGPVPILKFRGKVPAGENFWVGTEIDGFYAPISYLNGSDSEVEGAILDASLRVGYNISDVKSAFLNVRYLGGGAVGSSDDNEGPGDGYVKNWLSFLTLTVGFEAAIF